MPQQWCAKRMWACTRCKLGTLCTENDLEDSSNFALIHDWNGQCNKRFSVHSIVNTFCCCLTDKSLAANQECISLEDSCLQQTSINSWVQKEELPPCFFCRCIGQIINWAVTARRKFPGHQILALKLDYTWAYQRYHLSLKMALQACNQLLDLLRLTFEGGPCPLEQGIISETVTDLANAILHDQEWIQWHFTL